MTGSRAMDNELEKLLAEFPKDGEYAVKSINTALLKASLRKAHDLGVAFGQTALADKLKTQRDEVLEEAASKGAQACRLAFKRQEFESSDAAYRDGMENGCETCEAAVEREIRALKTAPDLSGAKQAVVEVSIQLDWALQRYGKDLPCREFVEAHHAAVQALQSAQTKGGPR